MPVAAIVGAAVVGAGASIISGKKAAGAVKDASKQSADVQERMFNQSRADNEPWRQVGVNALNKLAKMYGVAPQTLMPSWQAPSGVAGNYMGYDYIGDGPMSGAIGGTGGVTGMTGYPTAQPNQAVPADNDNDPFADFYASPDYKFRLSEGMKAIERSAAARGNLRSGATMKAVGNYAQDVASTEYGNYVNRLAALAGIGQQATSQNAQLGANYAGNMAQIYTNQGNARASAYANTGSAINNGITNVASAYLYNRGYNQPGAPTGGASPWYGRG